MQLPLVVLMEVKSLLLLLLLLLLILYTVEMMEAVVVQLPPSYRC
jgi:hypothetical protein